MEEYKNRTGLIWRHYYGPDGPRGPPKLFMWPAKEVGQVHHVTSFESQWQCDGDAATCQSTDPVELDIQVISTHPKAFIIPNFLSEFEADKIIELGDARLKTSLVGNRDSGGGRYSDTRTSKNAWVPRSTAPQTETLFRRAADLLNVHESLLQSNRNVEDLQVINYKLNQKYDAHHDWGGTWLSVCLCWSDFS